MVAGRGMTMTGKPYLVLTRDEHAMLGELVEIMGLIESMLIKSAVRVDPVASRKIQNTAAGGLGRLWAKAISGRVSDAQIAALIPHAERELKEVAENRNDFVHALFEGDYVERGYVEPGYQATSARRSKTGKTRPTSDLQSIRDRAATLSCLVEQIANAVT
jgi:hypothetical protein